MNDENPNPPRGGGPSHALAAIVLAAVSTIVAVVLFLATAPKMTSACLAMGDARPSECRHPWWVAPVFMVLILGGWSSAAKVWRGR